MTHATNYLENALLDFTLRNIALASPSTVYVALYTAFVEDGTQTEIAGSNYARRPAIFAAPNNGAIESAAAIDFPTAADNWGVVTHVGICDAASGGNVLFWSPLSQSRNVIAGRTFSIEATELSISLAGDMSIALRNALLDHLCRSTAYTPAATVYAALLSSFTNDQSYEELTGSGYARTPVALSEASGGIATNDVAILFDEASANWPQATHVALLSAPTGGNLLYRGVLDTPVTVSSGETFRFAPGELTISHD